MKLTPRADDAGPTAPETLAAGTVLMAELAKTNVISATSDASTWVVAVPVKVSVTVVPAPLTVRTGVRPAGTFQRVTSVPDMSVLPALVKVAPVIVAMIEPETAPAFGDVSVIPRPE